MAKRNKNLTAKAGLMEPLFKQLEGESWEALWGWEPHNHSRAGTTASPNDEAWPETKRKTFIQSVQSWNQIATRANNAAKKKPGPHRRSRPGFGVDLLRGGGQGPEWNCLPSCSGRVRTAAQGQAKPV
jgi:hypothetical protein